jgi:hypothetical protein
MVAIFIDESGNFRTTPLSTVAALSLPHGSLSRVRRELAHKTHDAEIEAHRLRQCEQMTRNLTPEHHADLVAQVWELRQVLERMSNQLSQGARSPPDTQETFQWVSVASPYLVRRACS